MNHLRSDRRATSAATSEERYGHPVRQVLSIFSGAALSLVSIGEVSQINEP
jgi:hypothetical protein